MLSALALAALLVPQEPPTGAVFTALHGELDLGDAVDAARTRLTRIQGGEIRALGAPHGVTELRGLGPGAVDAARDALRLEDAGDRVQGVIDLVATRWTKRVPRVPTKRVDLRGFENLCEHAYRDLLKALGSGRDLDTTASQLLSVLDHVRPRGVVDGWDKPTLDLVEERFVRVGRVDRDAILSVARRLVAAAFDLDDEKLVERLRRQQGDRGRRSVKGDVLEDRDSSFGRFVVGGFGDNEYDCSQVDVIVDFGGNDVYRGPAAGASEQRRMAVVIDLSGNDVYQALNGAFGSATFGVGVLIDLEGDDVYRGGERCLGFGAAGVGIALDLAGDDQVEVGVLGGGVGLAGIGVFADFAGDDVQTAGAESFGCGLPGGLGVFIDLAGDDERTLGLETIEHGGRVDEISVGFGAGFGGLPSLAGGLGICLDIAGNDKSTASGLAFGVAARGGAGLFRDVGGDDTYRAGAAACGAAFSGGVAVAIDEGGNDRYSASEFALAAATGGGFAWFVDTGGDDVYAAGAASFGSAMRGGIAGFADLVGEDGYEQLPGELAWPVGDAAEGAAVATFLDAGGGLAQFEKLGVDFAEAVVRVDAERDGHRETRVLVRR